MNGVMVTDGYLKIFTGLPPFHDSSRPATVILKVMKNMRPDRPPHPARQLGLEDQIWRVMQSGWASSACDRPSIQRFPEVVSIV